MATKEDIENINKSIEALSAMMQTLTTRVTTMEQNKVTVSTLDKLKEQMSKISEDFTYVERPPTPLDVKDRLPEKFSTADIPKFKPTDNPIFHLKAFSATMALKGLDVTLFPTVFPLSLEHACQQWFYSLDAKHTATWQDVTDSFMNRYKCNIQTKTSERELSILKQKENEGFTAYLNRWRETTSLLVDPPKEREMVRLFIQNLTHKYREHLKFLPLNTFEAVYDIGINIEDELIKTAGSNNNNTWKNKKNDHPSSSSSKHENTTNNISQVDLNEVLALDAPLPKKKRTYTPLGMTYDAAFDRLYGQGLITPIGPFPEPKPEERSAKWNPNAHCKYHQGRGHTTEQCWNLKDVIQDLVDANKLPVPPGGKK